LKIGSSGAADSSLLRCYFGRWASGSLRIEGSKCHILPGKAVPR